VVSAGRGDRSGSHCGGATCAVGGHVSGTRPAGVGPRRRGAELVGTCGCSVFARRGGWSGGCRLRGAAVGDARGACAAACGDDGDVHR
jgi:hypothetical protein